MGHTGILVMAVMVVGGLQAGFAVELAEQAIAAPMQQIESAMSAKIPQINLGN